MFLSSDEGFSSDLLFVSSGEVSCVVFDPQNPNILASCSYDKTIKIWDITSGSCLSTLSVDSAVNSVAFSPDGFQVVAGCDNGCIYLWRQAEDGGEKKWKIQSGCPLRGHRYDPFPCIECLLL